MPWKLVGFIICLILGTCFAGFNLENSCNISFGFKTFQNVPIFFSLIVAFSCGVLVTLPFTVIKKKSAKEKKVQAEERAMRKIRRQQDKESKDLEAAEKRAAKEARQAEKEAKKLERQKQAEEKKNKQLQSQQGQNSVEKSSSGIFVSSGDGSGTTTAS